MHLQLSHTGLQSAVVWGAYNGDAVLSHHQEPVVINGIILDGTTELRFQVIIFVQRAEEIIIRVL
jgi:hypothetical protein